MFYDGNFKCNAHQTVADLAMWQGAASQGIPVKESQVILDSGEER